VSLAYLPAGWDVHGHDGRRCGSRQQCRQQLVERGARLALQCSAQGTTIRIPPPPPPVVISEGLI
jgi:hypothetical protein